MPDVHESKVGRFCWFELGTTDQEAARKFYSGLFGWTSVDHPMGPDGVYTIFQRGGRDVGACYTQQSEQREQGVPPNWATYIAVTSADETAAKAAGLGGSLIAPPFDVFDIGRMAVISDPTGAVFCVWQAKKHGGAGVIGEPWSFCWSELYTRDSAAATKFYTGLFGWGAKLGGFGPTKYTEWQLSGASFGGMLEISPEWGNVPPHWLNYVSVPNCDAIVAKAAELGGSTCRPATEIPHVGRFAVLRDPQGATFAIIQLAHQ